MSAVKELRRIDYFDYYSSRIRELDLLISQQAKKGHGHRKLREKTHRIYRNGPQPRGFHDYQNLQWDPNIYRGKTYSDFREKNLPSNATVVDFNKYCCLNTAKGTGTSINRRKTVVALPRLKLGGIFRPTTNDIIFEETSGRKRHKQDESRKEMAPFIIEQLEPPEYTENGSQADEVKKSTRKACHRIAIGTSTGSQADICIIGTGSKEDPLQPILSNMGSKVLEQSLLETFEEFELHEIRSEIRCFIQRRRNREAREKKQAENQQHKATMLEFQRIRKEYELKMEMEATEMTAAALYAINACNRMTTNVLNDLRVHKFMSGEHHDVEKINPWMQRKMYRHLKVPRMIVDDIIRNVETVKLNAYNTTPVLNGIDGVNLEQVENGQRDESEEEGSDYSLGPPPNTASSIPTSEEEDHDYTGRVRKKSVVFS